MNSRRALGVGLRREDVDAEHDVRPLEPVRRLEAGAVQLEGLVQRGRREVRREGVRQAELGRELRAEQARAQDPDRYLDSGAGHRAHELAGTERPEIVHQLDDVLGEGLGGAAGSAAARGR